MYQDVRRTLASVLHALLLPCALCAVLVSPPARALDPQRPIGQFSHVWYENQLPQGTVLSIAQQGNGSIWLATYGGLVRHIPLCACRTIPSDSGGGQFYGLRNRRREGSKFLSGKIRSRSARWSYRRLEDYRVYGTRT